MVLLLSSCPPPNAANDAFILRLDNDGNGITIPAGEVEVKKGVPVSIAAFAHQGFIFRQWDVKSGAAVIADKTSPSTTVTLDKEDAVLEASFAPQLAPRIKVRNADSYFDNGGSVDGGEIFTDVPESRSFTIENAGNAELHLSSNPPVVVTNTAGNAFSIETQPAATIAAGGSVSFSIGFSSSTPGAKSAAVSIASDDPTEDPFSFTLSGMAIQKGSILVPNGGEVYAPGLVCSISWRAFQGSSVRIELYRGLAFDSTIKDSTPDDGSFSWTIPAGQQERTDYRVRITSIDMPALSDDSDADFTIGSISLVAPNGGEFFETNSPCTIQWSSIIGKKIKLELMKGGAVDSEIGTDIPNGPPFSYEWQIPADRTPASDYRVRVTSLANASIQDESASPFRIRGRINYGLLGSGNTANESLAIVYGRPWVTFADLASSGRARVYEWSSGTSWFDRGYVSSGSSSYTSIAAGSNFLPVVAFSDGTNSGKAHVLKWVDGTSWTDLGFASTGGANYVSVAVGPDNIPVVAFCDAANSGRVHVMKWQSGTTWLDYGFASTGQAYYMRIAAGTDSKPFVIFKDCAVGNNNRARVMRWASGTSFTDYGFVSAGGCDYTVIAVGSDNIPVAAFTEGSAPYKAHVLRWISGTTWTDLGYASPGSAGYVEIALNASNAPFVAYTDYADLDKPKIAYWAGSWIDEGSVGVAGDDKSIGIDPNDGMAIVVFRDYSGWLYNAHVVKRYY